MSKDVPIKRNEKVCQRDATENGKERKKLNAIALLRAGLYF